jgi:hypothetical protein
MKLVLLGIEAPIEIRNFKLTMRDIPEKREK